MIVPDTPSRPVVLVTGAARRLGRETALHLAARGYDVAVHFHRSQTEAEATVAQARQAGAHAQAFGADLTDEAACRALVPAVVAHFGSLRAVVNNASLFTYDNAQTCTVAAMQAHWQANTAPAVLLAQALYAHVREKGTAGVVVNLSDQKLWHLNPDYFSYTLSKAALESATVMLAQALAPELRVCGVAPGITLTSDVMNEAEFTRAHRLTPLRHSSTPADIAHAVRFLIESPAVTGTTLLVDGGQHLQAQARDVLFLAKDLP